MVTEDRNLSDFWRHDRAYDRVGELISILRGSNALIGNMGSDIHARWSTNGKSYTDLLGKMVALDYGPLVGETAPYRGSAVDEVIGYAAHEGGHCVFTAPGKKDTIEGALNTYRRKMPRSFQDDAATNWDAVLAELCTLQNILEDAFVDTKTTATWPVLGEYIRISRSRLAERSAFDMRTVLDDPAPLRNDIVNLWISVALYGQKLPKGGEKRVRQTVNDLMRITRKAIAQGRGKERQFMVYEVAKLLWGRYPVKAADPQGAGSPGGPSSPGSGAGAPGQPQAGDGASDSDDAGGGQSGDPTDGPEDTAAGSGGPQGAPEPPGDPDDSEGGAGGTDDKGKEEAAKGNPDDKATPGGAGAGVTGNLGDFDAADGEMEGGREVVPVPQEVIDAVLDAIDRELIDISEAVAGVLDVDPRSIRANAMKAKYDEAREQRVVDSVRDEIGDMDKAFRRQQHVSTHWLRGRDKGRLDDRGLHKPFLGEKNFRKQKVVLSQPDQDVGLLLDVSESMDKYHYVVEQTAAVFTMGLRQVHGINFAAWAYTNMREGRGSNPSTLALTRLTDPVMGGKLHLDGIIRSGGTPSGMAIAGAKAFLEVMPGRKKLLIHFTDGQAANEAHVIAATQECRKAGIQVYTIGMKAQETKLQQQYGEGNYETIGSVSELTGAVARIVRKLGAPQV